MILALDVGNTITVLGCIENGTILDTVRVRTEADATAAEAAVKIRDLLRLMSVREEKRLTPVRTVLACVGGALTYHFSSPKGLYVRLDGSWLHALRKTSVGGQNREIGNLTVGYDF